MITQQELKNVLHYNESTGKFTWVKRMQNRIHVGDEAGNIVHNGYISIGINNKKYSAHRLAFLWMTGNFPLQEVDHINRVKTDNRWVNLRDVSRAVNLCNIDINKRIKRNYHNKYFGFYITKSGTFHARIRKNGKSYSLGNYSNPKDAHNAYVKAAKIFYGDTFKI